MNNVDCIGCHQIGQEATRTLPRTFGKFETGEEAWMRRLSAGQSGEMMTNRIAGQLGGVPLQIFRRLDRPRREGRTAEEQAAAPAGRRAQYRGDDLGLVDAGQISRTT